MLRRTFLSQFLMLIGSSLLRAPSARGKMQSSSSRDSVRQLVAAIDELLQSLQPESRKQFEFSFEDVERKKWSNVYATESVNIPMRRCKNFVIIAVSRAVSWSFGEC